MGAHRSGHVPRGHSEELGGYPCNGHGGRRFAATAKYLTRANKRGDKEKARGDHGGVNGALGAPRPRPCSPGSLPPAAAGVLAAATAPLCPARRTPWPRITLSLAALAPSAAAYPFARPAVAPLPRAANFPKFLPFLDNNQYFLCFPPIEGNHPSIDISIFLN